MIRYKLEAVANITGGTIRGRSDLEISGLLIDSRTTALPELPLFFAITGARHNGHDFIPMLYSRGVRAFVVSELPVMMSNFPEAGFILVRETLTALQDVAQFHREQFKCPVIGITGSNGKTIVKEWLNHCLSRDYAITRSPKSYNSQVGVALSLWLMDETTRMGIFEAGISRPAEMRNLHRIIHPGIGIFTNIGEAHQENFDNLDQKITEKLKLFYNCDVLIYCHDHIAIRNRIVHTPELAGVRKFGWSVTGKADVRVAGIRMENGKFSFRVIFETTILDLAIPFTDNASLENALHCISLMLFLGMDVKKIRDSLADLPPVAMRLEQMSAIHDCTLINDSYNSDINSLSIALDLLNRQAQHPKKTLILSDILQSGRTTEELYGKVAAMVNNSIDRMIGIGSDIRACCYLFTLPATFYNSTDEFIRSSEISNFRNEAILLKGSRRFEFEKVSAILEQKNHTTRVEINLDALIHNLNYFRSLLQPDTKIMVMVKALSYGSGRHEIASILQYQGVNYLGVAFSDEGVNLRQSGITLPVIVMNPEPESFNTMIRYRLEPEIYSFRILELFFKALSRNQEVDYPIHIKLDTGMHRLGFSEDEIPMLCHELTRLKNGRVQSVFSHLAGSDEEVHDDFTAGQIQMFGQMANRITATLGYPVIRHILNSSGIERFGNARFDMVRLGIGLYGISSCDPGKLRTVSTLKSTILQIKKVNPGETVGYGRAGKINRASVIAIVPIGYADGLNRKLSNGKGHFMLKNTPVPIIGNICMDMTMVDITGTEAHEGDEVVVFGENNSISDIAINLGTIPYEILTGVSERVKRIYYHE